MSEPGANEGESVSEEHHEGLDSPPAVMMMVVARQNELNEKRRKPWKIHIDEDTKFDLEVSTSGENNLVNVAVSNGPTVSFANVGHYDPGMQRFLFYPELLPPDESDVLEKLAVQRRTESLQNHPRYDFDADVIRNIRKRQREVLLEDGLIYKIADRYKNLPSAEKPPGVDEFLIDDATSFVVCLTPKLGGISKESLVTSAKNSFETDDAFISISFQGDLYRKGEGMGRRSSSFLDVGYQDLDDPNGKFLPFRKLLTDAEFGKILGLAEELQHLKATTLPNLDTKVVALRTQKPAPTQ